ncbi:BACON domain-containing protein [Bacteroides fragilis]|nr:BACON domain-containing protein [Bacteroides fragilis]
MAKASWCNVSPMSGSENGALTISAAAHAGREARSTTVTVTAKNGTKPSASIAVSQAGVGVQLTMDTSKPDLPGEGGSVTINGNSNSPTLKISVPLINLPGLPLPQNSMLRELLTKCLPPQRRLLSQETPERTVLMRFPSNWK